MKSLNQVYNSIFVNTPPPAHAFVSLPLQSGLAFFARASDVEYGGWIPWVWILLTSVISSILYLYPVDYTWIPVSDRFINIIGEYYTRIGSCADGIASQVDRMINNNQEDAQLWALLGFLTDFIRMLNRLNFCFGFVINYLRSNDHSFLEWYEIEHTECLAATARLLASYRRIERLLGIDLRDSAF